MLEEVQVLLMSGQPTQASFIDSRDGEENLRVSASGHGEHTGIQLFLALILGHTFTCY